MAYCTISDLVAAITDETLIQLTDDTGSGVKNEITINAEIDNAGTEINAYCQQRYANAIPFSSPPGIVKSICIDIAIFRLYKRRQRIPEEISESYKAAVRKLENIAAGKIDLGVTSVSEDGISFTDHLLDDRKFRDPEGYL